MRTTEEQNRHIEHKHSTPNSPLLEIEREFDAPVERLFAAFKDPEAIKAWWWPKDLYTDRVDLDFRVGGRFFANMKGNAPMGGGGMTGKFEEIVENERLVMTDKFADAEGCAISAKEANMPGEWPETCYCTFEFESLGANRSRLHLFQEGIPSELQKDCKQGWSESFDKLDAYLAGRKQ